VVLVDLSGLDFMAVSGLNALVGARNDLQAEGRDLRLLRPPAHIDRMLRICGMADAISTSLQVVWPPG
jgi:anti-anti-sigma factor